MRIISQDGTIDIPYKKTAIVITMQYGNAVITGECGSEKYTLGTYPDLNAAKKAMQLLHENFKSTMVLDGGFSYTSNHYIQPNYWVLPKVFKFPEQDEDLSGSI